MRGKKEEKGEEEDDECEKAGKLLGLIYGGERDVFIGWKGRLDVWLFHPMHYVIVTGLGHLWWLCVGSWSESRFGLS